MVGPWVVRVLVLVGQTLVCRSTLETRPWYDGPTPTLKPQSCPVPVDARPPVYDESEDMQYEEKQPYTNLLELDPPEFLSNYKNPCWYECLQYRNPYHGGHYTLSEGWNMNATFDYIKAKVLPKRFKGGQGWRLRCLPNFFLIGAPKSGTTDLFSYITSHPDILGPPLKEPQWWAFTRNIVPRGRQYYSEIESFSSYVDIFDLAAERVRHDFDEKSDWHHKIIGDGSVGTYFHNDRWQMYADDPDALEPVLLNQHFIHHLLPDAKFIVILRNPTDRLYSGFYFYIRNTPAFNPEVFHRMSVKYIKMMNNCIEETSLRHCAYDVKLFHDMHRFRLRVGFDSVFLRDWFDVYDRKQFLILKFEEYIADRYKIMSQIFKFLDVDVLSPEWLETETALKRVQNSRDSKFASRGPMLPETRKLLDDFYEPYKQDLAKLLNDKKFLWRD